MTDSVFKDVLLFDFIGYKNLNIYNWVWEFFPLCYILHLVLQYLASSFQKQTVVQAFTVTTGKNLFVDFFFQMCCNRQADGKKSYLSNI